MEKEGFEHGVKKGATDVESDNIDTTYDGRSISYKMASFC